MQKLQAKDNQSTERGLSTDGIAFIKRCEGLRLHVYLCANGKATIGYGHLVTPNELEAYKHGIDLPTAERLFKKDIAYFVGIINYCTKGISLTQPQFDMLVSFSFNVGSTNFLRSTLLKDIQARKLSEVSKEMARWVHGDNGKLIDGLVKRRSLEGKIFDGKLLIEVYLGARRR